MKKCLLCVVGLVMVAMPLAGQDHPDRSLRSFVLVQGFYTRALGSVGEAFPSAAGGYLGYGLHFPDPYVLMMSAGFSGYTANESSTGDQTLWAIHFLVGPRYYFATDAYMPYLFLNVGLNIVREESTDPHLSSSRTRGHFAWQIGLGFQVAVAGPVSVDLQAKYNAHFLYHEAMMTGFEYGVGICYWIGG
jgi:opacity protein-like surface antigen